MASKYLAALGIGFEVVTDVTTIQPLHHEARFLEVKKDFEALLAELQQNFLPNDKIAAAVVKGAKAGIDAINFADIEPLAVIPAPATPTPAPAQGGGV